MFFRKNKNDNENNDLIKVAALLIHAARIDENYSKYTISTLKHIVTTYCNNG